MSKKNTRSLNVESLEGRDLLSGMGIVVPAYIDPTDYPAAWTQLNQAASQVQLIAIANPYGGPISGDNAGYNAATTNLHNAGGKPIGYVSTRHGDRPIDEVKADIAAYSTRFNVDGIFLDELDTRTAADILYYQELYRYIDGLKPQWTVVGNPGTDVPESAVNTTSKLADIMVMWEKETGYNGYTSESAPIWQAKYDASGFANLVMDIPTATQMQSVVTRAASQHTGWMYVTDDNIRTYDQDPWDTLPSYFNSLVAAVKSANVSPNATAPAITTASLASGTVNTSYNQIVGVTGGTGTKTFFLASGSLPNGLGLNTTSGTISGTPTTAGTFTFTVKATDTLGLIGSKTFSVTVNPAAVAPLTITTMSLANGMVGSSYGQTIAVTGGTGTKTFSATGLPAGLTINATTGLISGTPTVASTFSATIKVTAAGSVATKILSIKVTAAPLSITTASLPTGTTKVSYSQVLAATGGTGSKVFSLLSGSLPAGLSLTASGLISGKTNYSGTFNFTAQVKDAAGVIATKSFSLTMVAPPLPSQLTNLKATGVSTSTINLTWTASANAAYYQVFQHINGEWVLKTTKTTGTSYSITGLASKYGAWFYVMPYNSADQAGPGAMVWGATL